MVYSGEAALMIREYTPKKHNERKIKQRETQISPFLVVLRRNSAEI
jgi:hypothetical protein